MERAGGQPIDPQIIEYNDRTLPALKDKEPQYTVVSRLRRSQIKPGGDIEVDIYFTGAGIPDASKLYLGWLAPDVISAKDTGQATWCIQLSDIQYETRDLMFPATGGGYCLSHELAPNGVTISLNKAFFMPSLESSQPEDDDSYMPQVVAERSHDGHHPFSVSLKTLKNARRGDYRIDIVLTYSRGNTVKQACDKVEYHVTDWWDRNQGWVTAAGTAIAFIVLILTAIGTWVMVVHP